MTGDDAVALFSRDRERLFALAYRMLGSVQDAEDIVQETFLRWHRTPIETLESPSAWLTTVATRLALNQLQSARVTREAYVGPWLPEPLVMADAPSPSDDAELSDSLSIAFLTVLERLSPRERAVFLLRDVFDYEYDEVARIVGLSDSNCRQVFHRAKLRLDERRKRFTVNQQTHQRLLSSFARAVTDGDVDGVVALLARDAVLWADGGGKVRGAALRPVRGADSVAKFVIGVRNKFDGGSLSTRVINGRAALIASIGGVVQRIVSIDVFGGAIAGVYVLANPDKLRSAVRLLM
jgi:RNA polymerase sigma-70 factor (ECF subfamily)